MTRRFRFPGMKWLSDAHSVDDEFAHHIELRAAALRAQGMSERDARAAAEREFGSGDDARAYCDELDAKRLRHTRRFMALDELQQDLHYAFRQITRHRGYAAATIAVLGLGLALLVSALSVADRYLVRPLPFPESERLVSVHFGPTAEFFPRMPDMRNVDWTVAAKSFDGVVSWDLDGFTLMGGERPEYADGAWVSPGYFSVLGVRVALGRGFDSSEFAGTSRVAIISDALWKRKFGGDSSAIGASVRMFSIDRPQEQELVTIVGVLPADAWHINEFTEVLRPLTRPRMFYIARLPDGVTLSEASSRLNGAVRPQVSNPDPAWSMSLATLHAEYVREVRPAILALVIGALLTLSVAVTNVAGIAAVRAARRRSEFALRSALGAGRGRIARQALVESFVLTGCAAIIGVGLARTLLVVAGRAIERQLGVGVPGGTALSVDWRITWTLVPAVLIIGVLSAWRASRAHRGSLNVSIRPGGSESVTQSRLRTVLMGAQVALTFALLTGAGLMARTAWHVTHLPLGFDVSNVYGGAVLLPPSKFTTDSARRIVTRAVIDAVARRPDVAISAAAWPPPFRGTGPVTLRADGETKESNVDGRRVWASERYFDAVQLPLTEGRLFDTRDGATAVPVVVLSARLAKALAPNGSAIGARIRIGAEDDNAEPVRTVVGVVGDARSSLIGEQVPEFYTPLEQSPRAYFAVIAKWKGATPGNTLGIRDALASVDETLALAHGQMLEDSVNRESARPRALSWLLIAFSSFGLFLAALGLASSLAHAVAQRRPELALRLALGASPLAVFGMIVRDAGVVVATGILGGVLLSIATVRVLSAQLHGVSASDPLTYAAIALLVVSVAFVAAILPARSAAMVDPARTLRSL